MSSNYLRRGLVTSSALLTFNLHAQSQPRSHIEFSRYIVPGMCVAAVRLRGPDLVHTVEYQNHVMTVGWNASDDSVVRLANQTTARQCGSRFTVENVAADDRWDLLALALMMQNDTLAASVKDKLLATAKGEGKDTLEITIAKLVDAYAYASPPRYDQAEALLAPAAIAALPSGRRAVVSANAWIRLLATASSRLDRSRMRRYAERVLASTRNVPTSGIAVPLDVAEAMNLPFTRNLEAGPDSSLNNATTAVDYANRQLAFLAQTDTSNGNTKVVSASTTHDDSMNDDSTLMLTPTAWFPAKPSLSGPTLILSLDNPWGVLHETWNPGCMSMGFLEGLVAVPARGGGLVGACQGADAWLRMLTRDYTPKGLSVIVAMSVRDSVVFNSAPFAPLSISEGAQREVWYFRTHRAYPVTIAMYEHYNAMQRPPLRYGGPLALLRNTAGKIIYNGPVAPELVVVLDQLLRSK